MRVVNLAENGYKVSGGLHGVGISVVNALSEHVKVQVKRDGTYLSTRISTWCPQYDIKVIGDTEETGTTGYV